MADHPGNEAGRNFGEALFDCRLLGCRLPLSRHLRFPSQYGPIHSGHRKAIALSVVRCWACY